MAMLSQHEYDYLVVIDFEATCDEGEQPKVTRENQEIIEFPWVVIDLVNQQVIDKRQIYVRPEWTSQLTPFCVKLTGITDDKLREAPLLHEAMAQFDRYVDDCFARRGKTFCILTDGDWDLKMCLLQETRKKDIARAPHYMTYFDVKEEFLKVFPQPSHYKPSLMTMLRHLNLVMEGRHHSGLYDCVNISNIVLELIRHGHYFGQPQVIPPDYDPSTDPAFARDFNRTGPPIFLRLAEGSEEETKVIVMRGLPWSATDADVGMFFSGLDIVPGGIHLIHDHTGRPSGVAYVEFSSAEEVNNALQRHNGFIGSRYIEVYPSDANSLTAILASQAAKNAHQSEEIRPGDWYCINCGDHQFASRIVCRKCSTPRPAEDGENGGYGDATNNGGGGGLVLDDGSGSGDNGGEGEDNAGAEGEEGGARRPQFQPGDGAPQHYRERGGRKGFNRHHQQQQQQFQQMHHLQHQQQQMHQQQMQHHHLQHQQQQQQQQLGQMPNYYAAASNPNYYSYYQQLLNGMGVRPGDWLCASCNELNFASRRVCRKCNFNPSLYFAQFPVHHRAHDWRCPTCADINFGSRTVCRKCGTAQPMAFAAAAAAPTGGGRGKPSGRGYGGRGMRGGRGRGGAHFGQGGDGGGGGGGGGVAPSSFRPGDWFCDQCKDHNFASRKVCRKCGAERGDDVIAMTGEEGGVVLGVDGGMGDPAAHVVVGGGMVMGAPPTTSDVDGSLEAEQRGVYGW
ncbi:Znfinger in Ran binding protein [Acanthamoeba castellanii str. Neff]|uniref:Znfinger in Ran binding protein n=1 Tax=Acanthamoeba castellanii (strain ATCC 30010 / Neff) TaxID=1257118 RepID=L8HIE7_ACACF|nr:Znfinger in Ran binding protein [Acanthamoeba castellanii str. Neff]ELR24980.1 Znfinger in Ran binding protein [Acanthamoeba castellanii str. Neff]